MTDKKKDVSTMRDSLCRMDEVWTLIETLNGGTPAMRRAAERYLPKWLMEDRADYLNRLAVSTLFPVYTETVGQYVARLFTKPLLINPDVPDWIKNEVLVDVNFEAKSVQVFARDWFRTALDFGMCPVLVDSPELPENATVADQKAAGARPYYVKIHPRSLLGWITDKDGKLIQFRYYDYEEVTTEDGYNVEQKQLIRVYKDDAGFVSVETHHKIKNNKNEDVWALRDTKPLSIDIIPIVIYYTKSKGVLECDPPLRELAYMNQKHWSVQSTTDALLQTASVPILAIFGGQSDTTVLIGSKNAVLLPHDASMKFVEHTGVAIQSGRTALDSLKDEMRQAGAKLLPVNNMQAKNPLQAGEEANKEASPLGAMVQDLTDAFNQLLYITALWRKQESGGTVTLQANMDASVDPIASQAQRNQMFKDGSLTIETNLREAQRDGIVDKELDVAEEAKKVVAEQKAKSKLEASLKPKPVVPVKSKPQDPGSGSK